MPRKYENCPIVEVLCAFDFQPSSPWSAVNYGLLWEAVRDAYPEQEDCVYPSCYQCGGTLEHPKELTRYFSHNKKDAIQVRDNYLAVNQLEPYIEWEEYQPKVVRALKEYFTVIAPTSIKNTSLRYMNLIKIPVESPKATIKLEEYFKFYPMVGDHHPDVTDSFNSAVQFPQNNDLDRLGIELSSCRIPDSEVSDCGFKAFSLEIVYEHASPMTNTMNEAIKWLEDAHKCIITSFEGCITDKLRDVFVRLEEK